MKINLNLKILMIVIITVAVIGITMSILVAHISVCGMCKDRFNNLSLWNVNKTGKELKKSMVPIIYTDNGETAGDIRALSTMNVIQQVLENTVKTNDNISLMAVYSEDGTILAHLKPERIGRNMFDVDMELSYCMKEMYKAMKNRRIYSGFKYDPSINDYIRFIVKPLQIGNFDQKLLLLIGVHKPK